MRGISGWEYRPYARLDELDRAALPFVCRVAPGRDFVDVAWRDARFSGAHTLFYRARGAGEWRAIAARGQEARITGLDPGAEVEFCVERAGAPGKSGVRIARTGDAPGTVVNYLHPEDETYACSGRALCSPSIAKLPSGRLVASMDVYAPGGAQNLTILCASDDGGATWRYLCELMPCFWGALFVHAGALWMLANAGEYGDLLIGRSDDEGETWTPPVRLFPGGGMADAGPHKAPMPVVAHAGRLYTGIDYGSWKRGGHANALLSIDESADLMRPENWALTRFLPCDPLWPGASAGETRGAIEGNAVPSPDGGILNVLRYNCAGARPSHDRALVLRGDLRDPEARLSFERFADMPGGSNSKFALRFDPATGRYLAIVNEITNPARPAARTVLSLAHSPDLVEWTVATRIVDRREDDPARVGFQYPDFIIDGDDLLGLVRTACAGARNFHDANHITFHRIPQYRSLLK